MNPETDAKERIRILEEKVEYLEKEKHLMLEAINLAADLSNFQTSLNKIDNPLTILRQTADRIRRKLDFGALSFYLINEENSDFYLAYTEPESQSGRIQEEINALVEDKTFAWALNRNKPVIVSSIDKQSKVILHAMRTSSRNRGIFVGIMPAREADILDLSLFLFSLTIIACSNALESYELYRQIRDKNRELEEHIAAQETARKKLQESEVKYRALFEQSTHSIILYDPATRKHVEFNDLACANLGYTRGEFKTLKIEDYCMAGPEEINARMKAIFSEGQGSYEGQFKRKDGMVRDFIANARAVTISGNRYMLTLLTDVTERRRAETERRRLEIQLRQAQKMESLGTLAGGIAHDFNNILGVILGYSELSLMELPTDPSGHFQQYMEHIIDATTRARDLVHQILTFSRQGEEGRKAIDVNVVVKETLKLLRPTLPKSIEIRRTIPDEPSIIMGTPSQIQQIIMNLCTNSLHSMQGKTGVLEISIRTVDGDSIRADTPDIKGIKPRPYIQITVSDTGHGISREILDRVFDPYFTTKEPDEGTGLGLSVVHGIVKSYAGHIDIDSQPDRGTVVRIWFPAVDFIEITEEEGLGILPTGTEKILLVDDEEGLLIVNKEILEQLHYRVVVSSSGKQALDIFHGDPSVFDLVITDMAMPGMTGTELAEEILSLRPGMPIILSTGFSEYMDAQKAKAIGIREYLMKPVNKRAFATIIRKVLDEEK